MVYYNIYLKLKSGLAHLTIGFETNGTTLNANVI